MIVHSHREAERGGGSIVLRQGTPNPLPRRGERGWRLEDRSERRSHRATTSPAEASLGTLSGHFAVFNRWTLIDSWEGRFMESIAPGAFKKTFQENRTGMRCLFQHGRDPQVGSKPLGPIEELEEDPPRGAFYSVSLMDTRYNRDLVPGLRAGTYGASFRFKVLREEIIAKPPRSAHNPDGIEERRLTEVQVREFGPVTFGAYEDATAGVRAFASRRFVDEAMRIRQPWRL